MLVGKVYCLHLNVGIRKAGGNTSLAAGINVDLF